MRGLHLRGLPCAALCTLVVAAMNLPTDAAEGERKSAAEKQRHATALVEEALHREIYGDREVRNELLDQALAEVEGHEKARWHQGYVREHKQWVKCDQLPQMKSDYRVLAAYRTQRNKASDTTAAQLKLAQWCKSRNLTDQARAHLTRVLELEPNNLQARKLLGHRRIGETWVTPEQVEASIAQTKQLQAAIANWAPKLKRLLVRLESPSKRTREIAAEHLRAIDDPSAIPVIEVMLSQASEQTASYAVDALAKMSDPSASVSLARHAVSSNWQAVRSDAAQRLKDKPMEHYVPVLLGAMRAPVQARRELYRTPTGQLNHRYVVFRQGRQSNEVSVFESSYTRIPRQGGNRRDSLARAVTTATQRNFDRDETVLRENMLAAQRNMRITRTLSDSTGEKFPADPSEWWKWWDDYNEVFVSLEKPTTVRYEREQIEVEDFVPETSINISRRDRRSESDDESKDCLAAGTPVWTETGLVAIERIRIGDRVLAQDPQTGELAYKPVLRTTIRPRSRLTRIHLPGDESIATSGGHLFWCSGEGWVRSRDVKSGMLLHTTDGPQHVSFVQKSGDQVTYNLVVADFNTYFVGPNRVLSHDNTIAQPTDNLVPGHRGK
jgi:hypothetical protein